jgi:hypothetical protein
MERLSRMSKIIVEFSGWVECDSDKVMFQYIGPEQYGLMSTGGSITGTEWLKLSEDDRDNYMIEDYIEAQRTALDGGYEHLDVIIQNEDGSEVTASRTYS